MLYQATVRLGSTNVTMPATRRRVEVAARPHALAGRYFLVRHADEAVYATATADGDEELAGVVEGLRATRSAMWRSGELTPVGADRDDAVSAKPNTSALEASRDVVFGHAVMGTRAVQRLVRDQVASLRPSSQFSFVGRDDEVVHAVVTDEDPVDHDLTVIALQIARDRLVEDRAIAPSSAAALVR